MIERTEERFDIKPAYLAADTAYGSADTLNWIVNEKKIAPHIPVIDKSKREDGTFSREDFRFDEEQNIYICPAGKALTTTGHIGPDHAIRYQASRPDCGGCALKPKCCPNISSWAPHGPRKRNRARRKMRLMADFVAKVWDERHRAPSARRCVA